MKHFVSVIFSNQLNESKRDIVLDTVTNTAKIGLIKSNINYEIFESENNTQVLRLPLKKSIPAKLQKRFVEALANRLFDKGHNNFEIELSVINEATLRRGSRGPEVQALQQQLGIPADGIFGPQTEQAVRAFQQRAGIQVDGIVGGQTQSAIAAGGAPRNAGAPRPATAPATPPNSDMNLARSTPAAPATSPRPQPRPDMNLARSTPAAGGARPEGPAGSMPRATPGGARPTVGTPGSMPRATPGGARPTVGTPGGMPAARPGGARPTVGTPGGMPAARPGGARPEGPAGSMPRATPGGARPEGPAAGMPAARPGGAARAQTTASSARPAGQPGRAGMAGDEMNALDAIAADRASGALPTPRPRGAAAAGTPPTTPAAPPPPAPPAASVAAQASADAGTLDPEQNVFLAPEVTGQTSGNVTPRPTGSGRNVRGSQQSWDRRYGATHNPDGTPKNESVMPRPKGAFLFRERAEWDKQYGSTHNPDGSKKPRRAFFESRNIQEVTYDGNDFFEAYGVMWYNEDEELDEAEYQGRSVKLGKPMRGDVKKFKVYVRNPKGNVVKVNFGDPDMKIKKSNPARRRSFRARHNCDNPGPRHKARYWSCRKW